MNIYLFIYLFGHRFFFLIFLREERSNGIVLIMDRRGGASQVINFRESVDFLFDFLGEGLPDVVLEVNEAFVRREGGEILGAARVHAVEHDDLVVSVVLVEKKLYEVTSEKSCFGLGRKKAKEGGGGGGG